MFICKECKFQHFDHKHNLREISADEVAELTDSLINEVYTLKVKLKHMDIFLQRLRNSEEE